MKTQYPYTLKKHLWCITCTAQRIILLILLLSVPGISFSSVKEEIDPEYEEISVFVQVPRIGGQEIPAVIKGQDVYLAITDLFNFLKLKNTPSSNLDSISGFFLNPENPYLINKNNNHITFDKKEIILKAGDLIKTESNLYLKASYFGEIFGLTCTFNFRGLSVLLDTKHELPLIKEMRLALMRKNLSILKKEEKADTTILRSYPIFKLGMAEWSLNSIQQPQRLSNTTTSLALGAMLAGGEANIYLTQTNNYAFNLKHQQYLWRFVDNQQPLLKQVMAGKINPQAISSIYAAVVGLQLTNTATTYRRSFGTYIISNVTEPGWTVELYVNGTLIDYIRADASGFYKFEVPLIYGNTIINLRFYGPWGEERSSEQNISVPFNFLPKNEFEYTLTAGVVEDSLSSKFSRASFNYGLNKRLTVGGGMEYLSSLGSPGLPFVNGSIKLFSNLLFSGEYTYGVRSKSILTYRRPSDLQLELNYIKYDSNQKAIRSNYLEERKIMVSMPFRRKNFSAFSRFTLHQVVLPSTNFTTANLLFSGAFLGINTNFSTHGLFSSYSSSNNIFSNLSQTYRFAKNIMFTPQIQYDYSRKNISLLRGELEKRLFKGSILNLFYEKSFQFYSQSFGVGFRYNFSFARTALYARQNNNATTFTQSANGSLLYNSNTKYLGFNNRSSVGRGALIIVSFLDLNGNGVKDKDEPKLPGLNIRIKSGLMQTNQRDTTIQILELEPYINYFIELDRNSFENIAWQIKNATLNVVITPNQFKVIEVPVSILGEVSGSISIIRNNEEKGQGQIRINIYQNGRLAGTTLSESDGFFSYNGLIPGSYTVQMDPAQLEKLKLRATPESLPVTISKTTEGDVVDGLDFKLLKLP